MYIIYNYMPTYLHKKYTKTIPINLYYQKDKQFLAGKKSWNFRLSCCSKLSSKGLLPRANNRGSPPDMA